MKTTRWLPATLAGLALAACGSGDNYDSPPPLGPHANVQVIHAASDAPPVNVLIDGVLVLSGLDYGQGTGEQAFTPGAHTIEVQAQTPGSPTTVIGPTSLTFAQDMDYVIVADGTVGSLSAQVYPHALTTVPTGSSKVQVLHAAPGAPSVDVYVTAVGAALSSSTPLGTIAYEGAIGPTVVPSGTYQIRVTPAGSTSTVLFDSGAVTLPDGSDLVITALKNTGTGASPLMLTLVGALGYNARVADVNAPADVRFINASPDAPALAVVSSAASPVTLVPSLGYPNATAYLPLAAGQYTLEFAAATAPAAPLASVTDTFNAGSSHTVYALGKLSALNAVVEHDDIRRYATQARLQFVHVAPSAGPVDIYVTAHGAGIASALPDFPGLPFGVDTEYSSYAAGSYDVTVTAAGSKTPLIGPVAVTLADKGLYTAAARDAAGGGSPLGLILLDDLAP